MQVPAIDLEEYTHYHVHSWALMGFRFIICDNRVDYSIITPCLFEIPHQLLSQYSNQYMIPISDEQCFEMAEGIDAFTFYTKPIDQIVSCVSKLNN